MGQNSNSTQLASNRYGKAFTMQPMANRLGVRPPQIDMRNPPSPSPSPRPFPSKYEAQYKSKLTKLQYKVAIEWLYT